MHASPRSYIDKFVIMHDLFDIQLLPDNGGTYDNEFS